LLQAADFFRQAIDRDPTYAPAYAGLADCYSLLGSIGYDAMAPRDAMPLAKTAAKKALEIDETLGEAHASLANVMLSYEWDWESAEREFKRSIELNPRYATGHAWYGHLLIAMERWSEALHEMQTALELDPLSVPCILALGWLNFCTRDFDQAIERYRKALELLPNTPVALCEISLSYLNKRSTKEALAEARRAETYSGGQAAPVMLLGRAYSLAGDAAKARRQLVRLQELSAQKYIPAFYTAALLAGLDENDMAFEWFRKACGERSNYLIYLKVDPSLDNLRTDPRFQDLLRAVGLPTK